MDNEKVNILVKDSITEALLKLLKSKKLDKISITEITLKAGVGRVSFYRNFECKEDILKKYTDKLTDEFVNTQSFKYDHSRFKEYIIMLFEHLVKYKDYCNLLYNNNLLYLVKDEFDKYFLKNAKNKKEQFNQIYISGGLFNIFQFWLINGCVETPKELSDMFFNFIYSN